MLSKKLLFIGLFALGVIGFSRWNAAAATLGGFSLSCTGFTTCGQCFCTGSVEGGVFVKGPQLTGDTLLFNVDAPNGGLLACGNGGSGNPSPGIQIVSVNVPELFSFSKPIQKSDLQGNTVTTNLLASLDTDHLQLLANQFCPNSNWFGLDFVPCGTSTMSLTLLDSSQQQVIQQKYSCSLNSCNVGFTVDSKTKEFSFDSVPYTCTAQ